MILIRIQTDEVENRQPTLESPAAEYQLTAGQQFTLTLSGQDPEGDPLTYGFDAQNTEDAIALQEARFDDNLFTWTPAAELAGKTVVLTFKVQDDHNNVAYSSAVALKIGASHGAVPELDPILGNGQESYTACIDSTWAFTLHASDADGDPITYSVTGAPARATLNATTGAFSYHAVEADIGRHALTFKACDSQDNCATRSLGLIVQQCQIGEENHAPTLSPIEDQQVQVNVSFNLPLARYASDQDNDALSYTISNQPAGATINQTTGLFSYQVTDCALVGQVSTVTVTVSDGHDTASGQMNLTVVDQNRICAGQNHAPTLLNLPTVNATVNQTHTIEFSDYAEDQDGDQLNYSLLNAPSSASLDSTGHFEITPNCDQIGTYQPSVKVTDPDGLFAQKSFTLNIKDSTPSCNGGTGGSGGGAINHAPTLSQISEQQAQVKSTFTLNLAPFANDQDNDPLTFSISGEPAGATIHSSTGDFSYTVNDCTLVGQTLTLTVTVSDGEKTASRQMMIKVIDQNGSCNHAPVWNTITDKQATVGVHREIDLHSFVSDADGDALTYSLENAPGDASISNAGLFSMTPVCDDIGTYRPTVTATDPHGASATTTFKLTIRDSSIPRCGGSDNCGTNGDYFDRTNCNHDLAHAVRVEEALSVQNLKAQPGTSDWFKFTANAGSTYSITITYDNSQLDSNDQVYLRLMIEDRSGNSPDSCDASLSYDQWSYCFTNYHSDFATLVFNAPSEQDYYIVISNDYGSGKEYQLYFTEHQSNCPNDRFESNDVENFGPNDIDENQPPALRCGTQTSKGLTPWLSLCGDADWFALPHSEKRRKCSLIIDQDTDASLYAYKRYYAGDDQHVYHDTVWPSTPDRSVLPDCSNTSNSLCVCSGYEICSNPPQTSQRRKVVTLDLPADMPENAQDYNGLYYIQVLTNTTNVFYDIVCYAVE